MRKRIISAAVIALMIFGMAAFASAGVLRLDVSVPEGKTLKAYNFTVAYPAGVEVVKAEAVGNTVAVNANETGKIIANGYNVAGTAGPASVPVLKITVKGSAADAKALLGVTINEFGAGADDRFEKDANPVFVVEEE